MGKVLLVQEHNPPVVPIDPLSHSRINSFDNTQAAQMLGSGIQNRGAAKPLPALTPAERSTRQAESRNLLNRKCQLPPLHSPV